MMSFLKYYLITGIILGISQLGYSSSYPCWIEEMMFEGKTVKLNNGVICDLKETTNWQIDDGVVIEETHEYLLKTPYHLKNQRLNQSALIERFLYALNLPDYGFLIQAIHPSGNLLSLSDQSVWSIGLFNSYTTQYWKLGERLLVMPASDLTGFYLVNLDRPLDKIIYATLNFNKEDTHYRHFISSIQFSSLDSSAKIQLDNGFEWSLSKGWFSGNWELKELSNWKEGDEVSLYGDIYDSKTDDYEPNDYIVNFYLVNLRTLTRLPVTYSVQGIAWSSSIIKDISQINYFLSCNEIFITLNDGSYWKLDSSCQSVEKEAMYWLPGDRLLISRCIDESSQKKLYYFINYDEGLRRGVDYSCCQFKKINWKDSSAHSP